MRNGRAFLEAAGQLPLGQRQVIVLLTTALHEQELARARELPIAGFFNKPLTKEKVTVLLQEHFEGASAMGSSTVKVLPWPSVLV